MIALTVRQPWATMIALGLKNCENRTWETSYRGPLAIHAGKGMTKAEYEDALDFGCQALGNVQWLDNPELKSEALPRGAIIAVADLYAISDQMPSPWYLGWSSGQLGWFFRNVRRVAKPVACKGALGLWPVPCDVQRLIALQVKAQAGADPAALV